jgi:hypothetical protein
LKLSRQNSAEKLKKRTISYDETHLMLQQSILTFHPMLLKSANSNLMSRERSSLSVKDLVREFSKNDSDKKIDFFGINLNKFDSNLGRVPDPGDEELMRFPSQEFQRINIPRFHLEELPANELTPIWEGPAVVCVGDQTDKKLSAVS